MHNACTHTETSSLTRTFTHQLHSHTNTEALSVWPPCLLNYGHAGLRALSAMIHSQRLNYGLNLVTYATMCFYELHIILDVAFRNFFRNR